MNYFGAMTRPSDFRLLATGMTLSWLGNGFQAVALAVAVVTGGGGARDLGLVMAASVVAMLACTLFGGVWADRLQPTYVMIGSDAVRVATTAAMALMFATGSYHLPALCLLAAVSAGAGSFFTPAMMSLKPMLVPADRRRSTNATLSLLQTICAVVGPALGGVVVAAAGAPAGFTVNAASFLASLIAAALIRARTTRSARTGLLSELGEGWREIRSRDWLVSGVFAATIYHIANGVIMVLVQVVAINRLGGASAVGVIASAEGLGGVIGAAVAIRYRPRRPLRAGFLTLLLMPLWAFAYVWPAALVAVIAGAVIGYAGLSFFGVAWETAIQDNVPHRSLGKVASWDQLTSFLAMPLGNALAGPLSETYGIDPVLLVSGSVLLVAGAAPLLVRGTRNLTHNEPKTPAPQPA
jgi:predicted MFS family arabinose efflux permease